MAVTVNMPLACQISQVCRSFVSVACPWEDSGPGMKLYWLLISSSHQGMFVVGQGFDSASCVVILIQFKIT